MPYAKRNIRRSIKNNVKDVQPNYMMNNYLNSLLRQRRIAQFVSYDCQHFDREVDTKRVVERLYAVGVFTRYKRQMEGLVFALFAEFHHLYRMKR